VEKNFVSPLIKELIDGGYLRTRDIINAFIKINRLDFLRKIDAQLSDSNVPIPIGYNQTISQPLTVAFMLELLEPKSGQKILDVGSGSGWTTALLSNVTGSQGRVYGLEIIPELAGFGRNNLKKYNFVKKGIAQIFCQDGYQGLPRFAPFDRILVSAAAQAIPRELIKQLKAGGRLVIPIGVAGTIQAIYLVEKKSEDKLLIKKYPGFIFVPMVKDNLNL
jgi:protein-L-isoaspartate(D-aspartate) O-methyltransferase